MLVRWTAELHAEDKRFGLILVGRGPEVDPLRSLAAELGIADRVVFTGWLETVDEVGNYCNAADICVAMRTGGKGNEHIIPGALLHSMACGKVVIGPRLSGLAEIIRDGENGYMFAPDDGESFKELVRKLAGNRQDWDRVGKGALEDIRQHFTIEVVAKQYAAALEYFATTDLPGRRRARPVHHS
jgi:glycosyltransferase involved in cell wall biosynthesis